QRDVGLQRAHERVLGGVRLVQVLDQHGPAGLVGRRVLTVDRGHGYGLADGPDGQTWVASRFVAPKRVEVSVGEHRLSLSNLEKVLYPRAGFTKGHVIDYYTRIAPVLLP